MAQVMVGTFEIPDEIAKELSELIAIQSIRQTLLVSVMDDESKYENVEKSLIPVVQKIDAIKSKITNEYVPEQFNDTKYLWNYDGYEVSANIVQVYETK